MQLTLDGNQSSDTPGRNLESGTEAETTRECHRFTFVYPSAAKDYLGEYHSQWAEQFYTN